jgi:hypothetical protein
MRLASSEMRLTCQFENEHADHRAEVIGTFIDQRNELAENEASGTKGTGSGKITDQRRTVARSR